MAKDFSTTITGQKEIRANIAKLRRVAPQFTKDAVNEFGLNVQSQAKRNITDAPAVDTGQLRSEVKVETFSAGFAKRVGTAVKHGKWIENGTAPHFPPLEPIREWLRRRGMDEGLAFPIAKRMSEVGTPAKPWLFPAFEQERPKFERIIRDAWAQIARELA